MDEVTESEDVDFEGDSDEFVEEPPQSVPKQNFMAPKKPSTLHQPTLSQISSSQTEKVANDSSSLSYQTATSGGMTQTLVESEAARLKGQASIETDCSSRTLLGHNDTFDNSDFSDISFDH